MDLTGICLLRALIFAFADMQLYLLIFLLPDSALRLKNANYPNLQRTQKARAIKNPPRKFYPQDPNTF